MHMRQMSEWMKEGKEYVRNVRSGSLNSKKSDRISEGPLPICCNWRCWFTLRSRRRHPHAIASITIYEDPDGLGFPRVAPVSQSPTASWTVSLVDRSLVRWFVGTLAYSPQSVVGSLVQSLIRSRA